MDGNLERYGGDVLDTHDETRRKGETVGKSSNAIREVHRE